MLVTLWNACSKHPVVYPFLQSHHRGVRDELRVRDRNRGLGSLCGIVRINGITTVLKLISSAGTPAAAGVTELFLRIAGVQLCSFAHFVLRREDPFPIHGQNFNELWSRRLGYACRRVTADIILNLEILRSRFVHFNHAPTRPNSPGYFQELSSLSCTRCCSKKLMPYCS